MRKIKSFQTFLQENLKDQAANSQEYQAFVADVRDIEEQLNAAGVEVKSANTYYRPNSQGVGGHMTGECPYAYVKLANGNSIYVGRMYGKTEYQCTDQDRNKTIAKSEDKQQFLKAVINNLNKKFETFEPRKMQGRETTKKEIYAKEIKLIDDFVQNWQKDPNHIYETTQRLFGECPEQGGGGLLETGTQIKVADVDRTGDLEGTVTVETEDMDKWYFQLLDFAQSV